jgi:hypothetical protein
MTCGPVAGQRGRDRPGRLVDLAPVEATVHDAADGDDVAATATGVHLPPQRANRGRGQLRADRDAEVAVGAVGRRAHRVRVRGERFASLFAGGGDVLAAGDPGSVPGGRRVSAGLLGASRSTTRRREGPQAMPTLNGPVAQQRRRRAGSVVARFSQSHTAGRFAPGVGGEDVPASAGRVERCVERGGVMGHAERSPVPSGGRVVERLSPHPPRRRRREGRQQARQGTGPEDRTHHTRGTRLSASLGI